MPSVPRITAAEAKRAFEQFGFVEDRTRGSHCILKKEGHPYRLTIPMHAGKTLGVGLLKSLIRAAGLTVAQFNEAL